MINYLSELSKHILPTNQMDAGMMSDLYHEIAEQNFIEYYCNQNLITSSLIDLKLKFNEISPLIISEIIGNNEISNYFKNNYLSYSTTDSAVDLILNQNKEVVYNTNLIFEILSKTSQSDSLNKLFDVKEIEIYSMNIFKSGMITIAFEAFACEALINQELLKFMSKHEIKSLNDNSKKDRRPNYLKKIEKLKELKELNINKDLIEKLKIFMRSRNQIAHFSGFELNYIDLINSVDLSLNSEKQSKLYICEDFKILDSPLVVYKELKYLFGK